MTQEDEREAVMERHNELSKKPKDVATPLTEGELAILKRLKSKPLELYWGRSGWVPDSLPKTARRKDFDSLCNRRPALVQIELARLVLAESTCE